jgi:hypothetical protein
MTDLDDLFSRLNRSAAEFEVGGRSSTAALLIWFLRHVKRLDETEAPDAVCDGPGDKGIDGIWVDSVSEEIVLLQAKRRKALTSTQGDADLQKLVKRIGRAKQPRRPCCRRLRRKVHLRDERSF